MHAVPALLGRHAKERGYMMRTARTRKFPYASFFKERRPTKTIVVQSGGVLSSYSAKKTERMSYDNK